MQVVAIVVSLVFTAICLPLITRAVVGVVRVIRSGQPVVGRRDNPVRRTANMLVETIGHTRMIQRPIIGVMHWFVYAAFIVLSLAVLQGYVQLFKADFVWPIISHWYPLEWIWEALGLLSTVGIIYLVAVRQFNHPRRLGRKSRFFGSTFWQAYFVEVMAMLEGAAILFIRGAEYKLIELYHGGEHGGRAHFPLSSYVGDALYPDSEQGLKNVIYFIAMFKITLAMVWLIVIARNLTMGIAWHRFTAWPNIWFKRESDGSTALGALKPIHIKGKALDMETLEDLEEEDFEKLGVGKVDDFSWKGILDFTTCTECGRCQSQCPAWATDKPLSPKLLVMGLRDHAYAKLPLLGQDEESLTDEQKAELERPLIGNAEAYGVIDPDVLWSCTNCGACVQQCPVDIEHVDHIDDMRRFQVLVESNFPAELNNIFKGLERKGNPWGMDPKGRMDWAKKLDFPVKQVGVDVEDLDEVEWLFWVGCAGAFEDRAKKTTQAVAELLDMAGVTFAVLGDGETCTGDPARRAGNEIVFQQLAMQNAETFKETKVKKVVSTCAHCFNTLKNEYAEFGVELEVVHHTQLLNRLVREGKLTPMPPDPTVEKKKITYHDPCFLGRHNQVYEAPRELLNVIPGAEFTEMPRNSEKSFCCGAGGARMWMEETLGSRINVNRTEEAIATGADQIAVGCPFCRVMLSDGLTLKQSEGAAREEVEVLDVAQMLLAGVKRAPESPVEPVETSPVEPVETSPVEPVETSVTDTDKAAAAAHNIDVDDKGGRTGDSTEERSAETAPQTPDPEPAAAPEPEPKSDPAEEAEPDTEDKADPESISKTEDVGPAAEATETVETADASTSSTSGDSPAENTPAEPVEATATVETADASTSSTSGDSPAENTPVEPVEASDEAPAEPVDDRDASDKEKAAWANVGPVNTDLTPSDDAPAPDAEPEVEPGDTTDPETESVPEKSDDEPEIPATKSPDESPAEKVTDVPDETEPVQADEREEEAESTSSSSAKIISVEDAESTADPVSEDAAPLSEANPSGADLSKAASGGTEGDSADTEDNKKKS